MLGLCSVIRASARARLPAGLVGGTKNDHPHDLFGRRYASSSSSQPDEEPNDDSDDDAPQQKDVEITGPSGPGFEKYPAPASKPRRRLVGAAQIDFYELQQNNARRASGELDEKRSSKEDDAKKGSKEDDNKKENNDDDAEKSKGQQQEDEGEKTASGEGLFGTGMSPRTGLLVGSGLLLGYALMQLSHGTFGQAASLTDFIHQLPSMKLQDTWIQVLDAKQATVYNGVQPTQLQFSIGDVGTFERTIERAEVEAGIGLQDSVAIVYKTSHVMEQLVNLTLIGGAVLLVMWLATRKPVRFGGMSPFGPQSSFKIAPEKNIKTRFSDVAGLDEAKQEILEFVEFLKQPERFRQLGARIPRGALLTGPPGTGKTLLARAVAGEAGVPFFSMAGTDFIEMFVGVGPQRVRELFSTARKAQPCIVFIDEIDAVGGERFRSRNDERDSTLNQLLVEMDGFETQSGVIVMASTNRHDMLDKALLRPGRFDRQIRVDLPDLSARETMFTVHLKPIKLDDSGGLTVSDYSHRLASLSPGMSGADIANVCNEAALIAARQNREHVLLIDFEAAIERVSAGPERKTKVIAADEKVTIAHHEAGHAVAGWFLEHAHPLLKVSIVPRGESILGYAKYLPKDQYLLSRRQMLDDMCVTLGGRVAEQLCFGKISSGAANDLQRVTESAYVHAVKYGMNERIGPFNFPTPGEPGAGALRVYSEETAHEIDEEVRAAIASAYQRTTELLTDKLDVLKTLAARLLEREVIEREDLIEILGPRPFDETDKALEFYDRSKRSIHQASETSISAEQQTA